MTIAYSVLGQKVPAANTLEDLYTVPALSQVVLSTISVANTGINTAYRLAIRPAGAAIDPKHYIAYDVNLNANDSTMLTLGITLGAGDIVSVYSGTANVAFGLFGGVIS